MDQVSEIREKIRYRFVYFRIPTLKENGQKF